MSPTYKLVRAISGIGDGVRSGKLEDALLDLSGALVLEGHEVGGDASDVRAGHGGTAVGLVRGIVVRPCRVDLVGRREDVELGAVVGPRDEVPVLVNTTDRESLLSPGWRPVPGIVPVVARRDHD